MINLDLTQKEASVLMDCLCKSVRSKEKINPCEVALFMKLDRLKRIDEIRVRLESLIAIDREISEGNYPDGYSKQCGDIIAEHGKNMNKWSSWKW